MRQQEEEALLPAAEHISEVKIDIITSTEKHENMIHSAPAGPSQHQPLLIDGIDSTRGPPSRQSSFSGSGFGHAVADTFLCSRLGFTLLKYLGIGYRWMISLAALFLYGLFIMPGVVQVAWRYFFDKRIHRGIPYGQEARNRLDLYLPNDDTEVSRPVVAFVSGGAWVIGYKAWGSLLALQLVEEGIIVACIDYRNFPQGTISDMLEDVSQGISFICNNIANYGGDINRLYLIGQSAGAHLGACTLLTQAKKESEKDVEIGRQGSSSWPWRASQFRAYIGISGGYNLYKLADHFHRKGMYSTLFFSIMEGAESLAQYSPELCLQSLSAENLRSLLPPIYLFHGTDDRSIPYNASTSFVEALTSAGVQASTRLYEGKSHTDLFLQDPMRGGYNELLEDILEVMELGDRQDPSKRLQPRMVPECCLQIAHRISPF